MDSNGVSTSQGKPVETVLTDQVKNTKIGKKTSSSAGALSSSAAKAGDTVSVGMNDVYKSLTVLADKVLAKLDEILKSEGMGGISELNPENHTAEATAQRIVDGTTALFAVYAKQNPELEGEELLESFMETIRGGIKQGHNEAMATLGDLGALDIDGVGSGIEETMRLVEEKLQAFEADYRKQNGLSSSEEGEKSETTLEESKAESAQLSIEKTV